jgi:hypothetical protein
VNPLQQKLEEYAPDQRWRQLRNLHAQWRKGNLYDWLRSHSESSSVVELDRVMGRWMAELDESLRDIQLQKSLNSLDEVRRWCWSEGWIVLSQDEDLMLMDDDKMPILLDEIAHRCTKADYAFGIVMHHLRDSAHQACVENRLPERLEHMALWLPRLEIITDSYDIQYARRLFGYSKLRKVDLEEATQMIYDLRRCHPDLNNQAQLRPTQRGWQCTLAQANVLDGTLEIERATGRSHYQRS